MASRTAQRHGMTQPTRLSLVESDLDQFEEGMTKLEERLASMQKVLVGILISVTTASILLAVNVIVIGSRG